MRVGDNEPDALASILVVRLSRRLRAGSQRVVSAPALRNDVRRASRPAPPDDEGAYALNWPYAPHNRFRGAGGNRTAAAAISSRLVNGYHACSGPVFE